MKSLDVSEGGFGRLSDVTASNTDLTCCGSGSADIMLSYIGQLDTLMAEYAALCLCRVCLRGLALILRSIITRTRLESRVPNLDHVKR